jgi:type 1 glutamine amidotransferase
MKRRDLLKMASAAAVGSLAFPWRWTEAADKGNQRVLYFTRSAGFEHSVVHREGEQLSHSEKILTELGKSHGFEVECTKDGSVFDGDLGKYDAIAFYTSGDLTKPDALKTPPMSPQGKDNLLAAVAAGKGFLGFHAATDSFHSPGPGNENQSNVDPYIQMLGGEFVSHGPQQEAAITLTSKFPGAPDIEIGKSIKLLEEWYASKNFAPDLHVILVQETAGMQGKEYQRPNFPCTWARMQGKGRVFYTSLGHREDVWTNPIFQALTLGGLAWAMGNIEADVTPNFDKVTPEARQMPK